MTNPHANLWTAAQEEMGRLYYNSPLSEEEFGARVGHTRMAYKSRRGYVRRCVEIAAGRMAKRKKHKGSRAASCESIDRVDKISARPSKEMFADAQYRASLRPYFDIMGDPPPGYSALDKRVSS